MDGLVFPEVVTLRLVTPGAAGAEEPLPLAGVVFGVQTFHCRKNNYRLGPFFSDAGGVVVMTREALELSARAELDTGAMDYGDVRECAPDVEIRHWTASEVRRALHARQETWTRLLSGEAELHGSLGALLRRYREAPNHRLADRAAPVRDRWDGSRARVEYTYAVRLAAPA